jgi:large subunit ribosomal protein L29
MASKSTWHEMTEDALESELGSIETDLQKMKFEQAIRGIADNSQFKKMRQNTARILTELRKREIAEYTPEDLEGRSRIRARRARLKK